ncbi:1,4-alpha-glucan branching protein GlgB [Paenibacillus barcinonensis]|uniref:1,4-alpha-glucan branching enzyme GlgB n=2 Tax=Paenibacillus barcinonensis TaxID=198119 RepID=A0A2V4VAI5_PAEBA|nr:1,4-alpha-glucan branching protein GlgB [Paenibacillus barcinonensis]PYE49207.1 1,4-alpha-glucan branching enzyme [Paenibacillus barcinonensis]QKS55441.1 1,4-alpha-glucan branching protein GlgB [Paenibacillus barcinonensis]
MAIQPLTHLDILPEHIYLFHEGNLHHSYRMLGAQPETRDHRQGFRFTVWAPNAVEVGLAMDRNGWKGEMEPLYKIPESGFWSRFFPGIEEGTLYKFRILTEDGTEMLKADPYAFQAEVRPQTASVTTSIQGYKWNDGAWRRKQRTHYKKPLHIYEMHLGTWKRKDDGGLYSYREMADLLVPYLLEMQYTHVEMMPLSEHPYDLSWGYQNTGFYAPTSRYGHPKDLMYLVDTLHQAGIGVLLDWVPAHFAKDAHGLRLFDGTPLYEYADPMLAEKPGWGTLGFDYSKPEVRSFLISNALYWMEMYHFDGLRVDAVTSMLRLDFEKKPGQYRTNDEGGLENKEAVAFLQQLNTTVFEYFPYALMMAEESSAWPMVTMPVDKGGLGFNYKWNMGWMNDTLDYMESDFHERASKHHLLTFPVVYSFSENYVLPLSHDEVVHGKKSLLNKMPGSYEQKFAGMRAFLGYFMTFPGKKLLFMGGEFGQFIEWKDEDQLDWFLLDYDSHRSLHKFARDLSNLYIREKALWELDHSFDGYEWITPDDQGQSVISYVRKGKKPADTLLVLINFQPVKRERYRIGVMRPGMYTEILNSDHMHYGGSGITNNMQLPTEKIPFHGHAHSLEVDLPPLSVVILKKITRRKTESSAEGSASVKSKKNTEKKVKMTKVKAIPEDSTLKPKRGTKA